MPYLSPPTLTRDEVESLLAVTRTHPREHLIIAPALGTGLRPGEIVGLEVGDVGCFDSYHLTASSDFLDVRPPQGQEDLTVTTLRATFMATAAAVLLGLYAAGCGNDNNNPAGPGGAADVTINIAGELGANSFSPSPDTVSVGQTVAWHNGDSTTHTATSDNGAAFNTGNIAGGGTSSAISMNTAGRFPYHCSIHTGMTGILVVQ